MIIDKLIEYLQNNKKYLNHQLNESKAMYSFNYGRIMEIDDVLEWLDNLPKKEILEQLLTRIEENNCIDTYSYQGFNYHELKKLKEIL